MPMTQLLTQHPFPVQCGIHSSKVDPEHPGGPNHKPKSIVGRFRVEIATKGTASHNRAGYAPGNQSKEYNVTVNTMQNYLPLNQGSLIIVIEYPRQMNLHGEWLG